MEIVKVRYQRSYTMPAMCCVCGAPSGSGTYTVDKSRGRTRLSMAFPLCDGHNKIYKDIARRRRIGCGISLIPVALAVIAFVVASAIEPAEGTIQNDMISLCGGLLFLLAALSIIGGIIASIVISRSGPKSPVWIKSFHVRTFAGGTVTLCFENEQFASLFRQVNAAAVQERSSVDKIMGGVRQVVCITPPPGI